MTDSERLDWLQQQCAIAAGICGEIGYAHEWNIGSGSIREWIDRKMKPEAVIAPIPEPPNLAKYGLVGKKAWTGNDPFIEELRRELSVPLGWAS